MFTEYEKNVPYIVSIKEIELLKYKSTTIQNGRFCGFLVYNADGKLCFELDGNKMLVVVSIKDIDMMAPSKIHYEKYINRVEEELNKKEKANKRNKEIDLGW